MHHARHGVRHFDTDGRLPRDRALDAEGLQRLDQLAAHLLDLGQPRVAVLGGRGVQQIDGRDQDTFGDNGRSDRLRRLDLGRLRGRGKGERCLLLLLEVSLLPCPLPASPVFSRLLSTTNGCHPTVSKPRADRANSPTSTPPAVPTVWCTPWARAAGSTP